LEYAYYHERKPPNYLAIVIDKTPTDHDIQWFHNLQPVVQDIEIFWLDKNAVYSSRVSKQPLAKKAADKLTATRTP